MRLFLHVCSFRVFLALLVVTLVGCGGGGGSTTTLAVPVGISSGNAAQAAYETTSSADVSVTLGDTGMSIVGVQSAPDVHKVRIADLATKVFMLARGQNLSSGEALPVGVTMTVSANCTVSGTLTVTLDDVDNDGVISTGDTFSFTGTDCAFDAGTSVSGTMTFSDVTVNGDPTAFGTAWNLAMTISMSGFQVTDATSSGTMNGDLSLTMATTSGVVLTGTVGITSLRSTVGNTSGTISNFTAAYTENTNTKAYTITSAGTVSSSVLGGSVSFTTQTPLSGTDISLFEPEAGRMTAYGAGNSRLVVTAIGGGAVQLDVDADGDGTTDLGGSMQTTWAAL